MWNELTQKLDFWAAFGLVAQLAFTARFVVQWIASEREKRSVVPLAFWYFSLFGSTGLLIYALVRADPIFILGQSLGSIIYLRNLMLIYRERRETGHKPEAGTPG
ncbi:MAG: lipid-A-disaccharide synthase N-terminal domain-containing protein [Phycisphaerae bacterium]|nr:lipid-A-disaccharide synthase N-terminal domain-containing protein [Phycisphaerae bacterium]